MKNYFKAKTLCLIVSLLGTSMVSAQSRFRLERLDEDRRILLNTVGDELDILAQEKGYLLDKTSLRLSYPWSNLSPINIGATAAAAAVAAIAGGAVVAGAAGAVAAGGAAVAVAAGGAAGSIDGAAVATGGAAVAAIAGAVAAAGAVATGGAVAVAGGAVAVAVAANKDRYFHHKMFIVNHYRSKVSFSLMNDEGWMRTESCILFYSIEENIRKIDYEIDNCSNDDIFPQNEEGFLRVGARTDWFERHVSDQDDVVANGTSL